MKQFVALARVSSREQEREGFSLEVQEDALRTFALHNGGEIVRFFRLAETASKSDERKTFRELIRYAKKNAVKLDGLLFYKVDRAARNLFDYVGLERLESEYGVPFISVSQPTENSPAGRMMRRTLANMASFYTEQQSLDVQEGLARRVQEGWFVGKAPYGYRNVRINGRSIVEMDFDTAPKVKRLFHLFAYENLTLDSLGNKLDKEAIEYRPSTRRFPRSKLRSNTDPQPAVSPEASSTRSSVIVPTSAKFPTRVSGIRANMNHSSIDQRGIVYRSFSAARSTDHTNSLTPADLFDADIVAIT